MTSLAVVMDCIPPCFHEMPARTFACGLDCINSGFPGPDPNGFFDVGNEYLPVANPASLSSAPDCIDRFFHHVVAEHDFDFHFWKKIDHVFGAAV
jgi:hypothetical protein